MRVLILGGYGGFGGRLARLLAGEPGLTLLIAGRSLRKAQAFCDQLPPGAEPWVIDRDGALSFSEAAPALVVDASGPFQGYGARPYRVVEASLAQGAGYLDLADDAAFVRGVARFDAEARARGVFVLSGVSSFPALTAAVVRALAHDLDQVSAVTAGLAPSPHARFGLNVIRALAGYAGRATALRRDGRERVAHPFTESRRETIAAPGGLPLPSLRYSLVAVPDLQLLAEAWPALQSVWIGLAARPQPLHRALNGLAWLVRWRLTPSLTPLAPLFQRTLRLVAAGEHRSGLFVALEGLRHGSAVERSWHLAAEGDDGPLIPAMACAALIRAALAGRGPAAGARPALRDLELADFEALFAARRIRTGRWDTPPPDAPLYRRLLGEAFDRLPEPVRALHELVGVRRYAGLAEVERGRGLAARIAARLFGFPPAGSAVAVSVTLKAEGGRETWVRDFAGRRFGSVQAAGRGRSARLLVERFGPFVFGLALVLDGERLRLVVRRWSLFGLPLPRRLAPGGESYETGEDARFRFHVEIRQPLVGLIVAYRGWLVPC